MICVGGREFRKAGLLRWWRSSSIFTQSGLTLTIAALRKWSELLGYRAKLAELRLALRQNTGEIRKELCWETRRELTAKLRMMKGRQLDSLLTGYYERGMETLEMQLPHGLSDEPVFMEGRYIPMMTTTLTFSFNVWLDSSSWHIVRWLEAG